MLSERFKLAVYQFAPVLRDPRENARRIAEAVAAARADLLLTPELALTGYDVGDDVARLALPADAARAALSAPAGDVVLGFIERGADGVAYNAAAHLRAGEVLHCHRKLYLPTYGMFDEGRYFGRGSTLESYDAGGGWRFGILICEDFWHPALAYVLAAAGCQLLLVLAGVPGRGVWQGNGADGRFASSDVWERIARTTAQLYGCYVALANRTGVEGGVTFAGGSLIVAPTGDVLARALEWGDATLEAELSLAEVRRARNPYAHYRDDDPRLTLRELERALAAR